MVLEPCHDCQNTELQIGWDETGFDKWWHVRCPECSNERSGTTEAEAVSAWNTRALSASEIVKKICGG